MQKLQSILFSSILTLMLTVTVTQPASAGLVSTQSLLLQGQTEIEIEASRLNIIQQLSEVGLDKQVATQRVAQLTDVQITDITKRIDELPAGASVGGILLTVFIVLVITDVIGATDIFPFIKPVE
jgi:hypothetical protein